MLAIKINFHVVLVQVNELTFLTRGSYVTFSAPSHNQSLDCLLEKQELVTTSVFFSRKVFFHVLSLFALFYCHFPRCLLC